MKGTKQNLVLVGAAMSLLIAAPTIAFAFSGPQTGDLLTSQRDGSVFRVAYVQPIGAGWRTILQPSGQILSAPQVGDLFTNQRDGSQYRAASVQPIGAGWLTMLQAVA